MMHRPRLSATVTAALALAACAGPDPFYVRPMLTPLSSAEKAMECPQIHLAIDRADTVRWLVRERPRESSYRRVVNAADSRIRELLQLKRAQGCPPRVTALPGVNDLELLSKLELVQADIDARRGDEDALFKERTRLLDGLRIVPAPAAATISPEPAKDNRPASTDQVP